VFSQPIVPYIRAAEIAVRKPWHTPARRLLDYLVLYVEEGECVVEVERDRFSLGPGEICLIQPDTLHSLRGITSTVTPFLHLDIFFSPAREEGFPTTGGQTDLSAFSHLLQPRLDAVDTVAVPVRLASVPAAHFRALVLRAVELWREATPLSRLEANHLAMELVLAILRAYGHHRLTASPRRPTLDWLPAYLSVHIAEPLSVADMARRANLSPSRFTAVFRLRFGTSPHQYLLRLRIDFARSLLENTGLPLHEIAECSGFADVHHFAKTFRRLTGITPGAARRR